MQLVVEESFMFCVSECVDARMSDSEGEFMCSQLPAQQIKDVRSNSDDELELYGLERVVTLEACDVPVFNVAEKGGVECRNERVLYNNILIEDISSDKEIDSM